MKAVIVTVTLLVMLSAARAVAQQGVPFAGNRAVTVMTRNVYNGVDAELSAVPAATGSSTSSRR